MNENVFQFPDRTAGVVPQRIADARIALQLSRSDVARELNVSGTAVGYYENGDRRPDMNTLMQLSSVLKQPVSFFFKETSNKLQKKKVRFFRSVGPKSNKVNMALDVRTNWLSEFVDTLLGAGIRLPAPNVPLFNDVEPDGEFSLEQVEYIAARTRRHWALGDGPINNMVALLESQGVIVGRFGMASEKIDAFSCWIESTPFIILGSEKGSAVRSRFDAAHELGHLILHRDITLDDMESKSTRLRIEREANWFAGAFLVPKTALLREFYSLRASHLKGLKQRWLVSMQSIAHRARDIGVIDDNQYVSFRIQMTKRKELNKEPLDDVIPIERPGLLYNAWRKLVDNGRLPELESEDSLSFSFEVLRDHLGREVSAVERQNAGMLSLIQADKK
ncbi:XRE family transcriptional regulator [Phyllobacterium sp. YR531]|uniref:helix-turn-helix domain-containing protein n=1 Tax=Phyllobacterium sp. YR531 TaxID=1144343 RepID=UPI00026FB23C|nr:XRE family transcriptional regulator [Phyllobacterium sp. YR531]EJN04214.1 putative Zn peptidase [Phyllobacterium sp. YR531]